MTYMGACSQCGKAIDRTNYLNGALWDCTTGALACGEQCQRALDVTDAWREWRDAPTKYI